MPAFDDEQLQAYLKRFRPVTPDPLPAAAVERRKSYSFLKLAVAAALIAFTLLAGMRDWRSVEGPKGAVAGGVKHRRQQPLTLARVNTLLAQPQSFKTSLDELTTNSTHLKLNRGQQSALAILGKENNL